MPLRRILLPLLLALAASAGCGRNHAGTVLAPTGIRPAPATWPGGVMGEVVFDPVSTPDLGTAPFPPTRVELFEGANLVGVDSTGGASTHFEFTGVRPGTYSVVVRANGFYANSRGGIPVREVAIDAGNVKLTVDPGAFASGMEVIGTMPGFRIEDLYDFMFPIDVNQLYSPSLGVWAYPSLDYPDGQAIDAGTYRFKFATAFPTTVTNMTGWGDPIGGTLTAPVTNHPAVLATGSATDIVMTFPTTGVYAFTLDERRQTFSVQYLHPAPSRPALAARR